MGVSEQCTGGILHCHAALPVKYEVTAYRLCMHGMELCNSILATKVVNSLEKSFMVAGNGAICPTSAQCAASLAAVNMV